MTWDTFRESFKRDSIDRIIETAMVGMDTRSATEYISDYADVVRSGIDSTRYYFRNKRYSDLFRLSQDPFVDPFGECVVTTSIDDDVVAPSMNDIDGMFGM